MNRTFARWYCLFLLCLTASLSGAAPPSHASYQSPAVLITAATDADGTIRLQYDFAAPHIETVNREQRDWLQYRWEGETSILAEPGAPEIPLIARAVRVADRGNVSVRIVNSEYREREICDVMPAQPSGGEDGGFVINDDIYSRDEWYPASAVQMTEPVLLRDARIVALRVAPVQANPVAHCVREYTRMEIEIVPAGGIGTNEKTAPHRPVPTFAALYRNIIAAEDLVDEADHANPGAIAVVYRSGALQYINYWIDWKMASGHFIRRIAYNDNATLTSTTVYNDIHSLWQMQPPLEAIIIVGDGGATGQANIPAYASDYGATDHGYMCHVGNDSLADVPLGRFSWSTITELGTIYLRSIKYEKTPLISDTTWFTRGWGYANTGSQMFQVAGPQAVRSSLEYMRMRGIRNLYYDEHYGHVSATLINQRLNPGAIFWAHLSGWLGNISISDIINIQNFNKPFVSITIGGGTGDWEGTTTGMNEALTRLGTPTVPMGALAAVATAGADERENTYLLLTEGFFQGFGLYGAETPGAMLLNAKFQLWRNIPNASIAYFYSCHANMMGDATAAIWTGVPRAVTASLPDTLSVRETRLSVEVRRGAEFVPDARVTVTKRDSIGNYETFDSRLTARSNGIADMTLNNLTAGWLYVTVTSGSLDQNLYPVYDSIAVVAAPLRLLLQSMTLDDSLTGNNNHQANPGETLRIRIGLRNDGVVSIPNVRGELRSGDDRIQVTPVVRSWGTIAPNTTGFNEDPFSILLRQGWRNGDPAALTLRLMMQDSTPQALAVAFPVYTSLVTWQSTGVFTLTGDSAVPQLGGEYQLAVRIRNDGGLVLQNAAARLVPLSGQIDVVQPLSFYPSLPLSVTVSNQPPQLFQITIPQTFPGFAAPMRLDLSSGNIQDSVFFNLPVGMRRTCDPAGPDRYGYLAFDITDTTYQDHPVFQWVEIIPQNGGTGTRLNLNDGAAYQDASLAISLPITVRYNGQYYYSVTICSNGWLAFGVQPQMRAYINTRLPPTDAIHNLVAPFWDDLYFTGTTDGVFVKHDTTTHQFIVTWKAPIHDGGGVAVECQVLIDDVRFHPAPGGDAAFTFQYKTFNNVYGDGTEEIPYATIGISDGTLTDGIEYSFNNTYTAGAAPIPNGTDINHAVRFVSMHLTANGTLAGRVTLVDTTMGIGGATVSTLDGRYFGATDSTGWYRIPWTPTGAVDFRASAPGCNPATQTVNVIPDTVTRADFRLTTPRWRLQPDALALSMTVGSPETLRTTITLSNPGNGLLTWDARPVLVGPAAAMSSSGAPHVRGPVRIDETDEPNEPWQGIFSFPAGTATGDVMLQGVEFDGRNFWISGSNNGQQSNRLYKLSNDGTLLAFFTQPDSVSSIGWRDLAWDGRYLYGSSSRAVDVFDTLCNVVRQIPVPVNPARALAIDCDNGILFVADQSSPVYAIRLSDSVTVATLPSPGVVYGLAWFPGDPDGMPLYAFCRQGQTNAQVIKISPTTGSNRVERTLGNIGDAALGAAVTDKWNPLLWTFVALFDGGENPDRVDLYELGWSQRWLSLMPMHGEVPPGDSVSIQVSVIGRGLPVGWYDFGIDFNTNAIPQRTLLPISLEIRDVATPEPTTGTPNTFALTTLYPNPFNVTTTVVFRLPLASSVNLTVFDALGREAARWESGDALPAGEHRVVINAARLPSGVYFCRMQAGAFAATRKMVVLR